MSGIWGPTSVARPPSGNAYTAETLGDGSATDGSAGNTVTRTFSYVAGGSWHMVRDTYTYSGDSDVNENPVAALSGSIQYPTTQSFSVVVTGTKTTGSAQTITVSPTPGTYWPNGIVLTCTISGTTGSFTGASSVTVAQGNTPGSIPVTAAQTFTFTPNGEGNLIVKIQGTLGLNTKFVETLGGFIQQPPVTFNVTIGGSSTVTGAINVAQTVSFAPTTGTWGTTVLTPVASSGFVGTWGAATLTPSAGTSTPVTTTFTPTVAFVGTLSATATNNTTVNTPVTFTSIASSYLLDVYGTALELYYAPRKVKSSTTRSYRLMAGSAASQYEVEYEDVGSGLGEWATTTSVVTLAPLSTPIAGIISGSSTVTDLAGQIVGLNIGDKKLKFAKEYNQGALGTLGDNSQTTYANAPEAFDGTVFKSVFTVGGKFVLMPFYDNTTQNQFMTTGSIGPTTLQAASGRQVYMAVNRLEDAAGSYSVYGGILQWPGFGASPQMYFMEKYSFTTDSPIFANQAGFMAGPSDPTEALGQYTMAQTGTAAVIRKNGAQVDSDTFTSTVLSASADFVLTGVILNNTVRTSGYFIERGTGATCTAPDQLAIETNQLDTYGL